MKITNLLIGIVLCVPVFISADDAMRFNRAAPAVAATKAFQAQELKRYVHYQCPAGWSKVLDITNNKSKWSENSPVLICKPNASIINCPQGTYFYIGGNPNMTATGEIGCKTTVW